MWTVEREEKPGKDWDNSQAHNRALVKEIVWEGSKNNEVHFRSMDREPCEEWVEAMETTLLLREVEALLEGERRGRR